MEFKNKMGKSPLHFSAENGHFRVHSFLMDNVDDKNPLDISSQTPWDIAKNHRYISLCKLIELKIA